MADELTQRMAQLKAAFRQRKPIRTGSFIVTIFGDSIAPRGGSVWLGSLIEACGLLGIHHRPVRTAAYRLVQDGILTNEAVGRRSFYALTPSGRQEFDDATQRIYFAPTRHWDRRWCLVITTDLEPASRASVRKSLAWHGFGSFGSDLMAHPSPDRARLAHLLERTGLGGRVVVLDGELPAAHPPASLHRLVSSAWDLSSLERAYREYIAQFQPFLKALEQGQTVSDQDAFLLRTFMIHEYRKVLLRDPSLPVQLLPPGWHGSAAYSLSRQLYKAVVAGAENYLDRHFENQAGALPAPDPAFRSRFSSRQA